CACRSCRPLRCRVSVPKCAMCFARELALGVRGEIAEGRMRSAVREAVENADAVLDITGLRALRVLLHAGFSAYWPLVKSRPVQQIHAYEKTVQTLCRHWDSRADYVPDPVVSERQRTQQQHVV